jgi:hypothetical protein
MKLTPFIPLSIIWRCILGEGEEILERGKAPLERPFGN